MSHTSTRTSISSKSQVMLSVMMALIITGACTAVQVKAMIKAGTLHY